MKLQLTNDLLSFLKIQGYCYCLSKTKLSGINEDQVWIYLTPKRFRPRIRTLPAGYDTYFSIEKDVSLMANGIEGVFVVVILDVETTGMYILSILKEVKLKEASLQIEILKPRVR